MGVWIWMVGFNTGKYSRQETPFNVPGRIIKSMTEGAVSDEHMQKLATNFEQLTIGKKAPEFALPGQFENETISLSDFQGKTVLIEFWASWCGSCRKANGYLWDVYEKHHNNNFEIISISMDHGLRSWKKAIKKDNLPWPQACDGKGIQSEVFNQYGVNSLPRNYLLDETGNIIGKDMSHKEIDVWLLERG